jgi:hypothetical protein
MTLKKFGKAQRWFDSPNRPSVHHETEAYFATAKQTLFFSFAFFPVVGAIR